MNTTSNEIQTEGKIQVNLMSYKLLVKTQDIDERKFDLFERLAYQTRKSDEN